MRTNFLSEPGNLSADEKEKWVESLVPETVIWEVTLQCNMNCIHCGSTASPETKQLDELNTQEGLELIHQVAELGTKRLIFSGGEPFLRKDLDVFAREANRTGLMPSFISNGFVVNEDTIKKISDLCVLNPQTHIGLSLDGNEEIHDYLRQTEGSYKHVIMALSLLQQEGIHTSVVTTVSKLNFNLLPEIMKVIYSYDNVYSWQLQMATPWGRFTKDMMLSTEEYISFIRFIAEKKEELGSKIEAADDCGYFTEIERKLRPGGEWRGCHAGLRTLGLRSNGDVMGCLSLQHAEFIEGNIRDRRLMDFWKDPSAFSYNRNFKKEDLKGYCKRCPKGIQCQAGCKNLAYSISGSVFENLYCAFKMMIEENRGSIKRRKLK